MECGYELTENVTKVTTVQNNLTLQITKQSVEPGYDSDKNEVRRVRGPRTNCSCLTPQATVKHSPLTRQGTMNRSGYD